jgi:hypothetical protein
MNFQNTDIQIRPCIVSKAKFALDLKNNSPLQNVRQRCSQDYWRMTIDTICFLNGITDRTRRQTAIDRFEALMN